VPTPAASVSSEVAPHNVVHPTPHDPTPHDPTPHDPTPHAATRKLVFEAPPSIPPKHDRLYPSAPDFIGVANKYSPLLKKCFDGFSDSWTVSVHVGFYPDGSHGVGTVMRHEGSLVDKSNVVDRATEEQLKDCVLNSVAMWPWPTIDSKKNFDAIEAGSGTLDFLLGMMWE